MGDSIFESERGIDSANIYKCANCCSNLLHDGSEKEGVVKLKIKSNLSDEFSEIQIWDALEFIYGVSWKSIKNRLELKNRSSWLNPQEEVTFCNHCASLLTENYNSHQNFENSCHSSSLVKEYIQNQKRNGLIIESQNNADSSHPQDEIDRDEKTSLFDDFVFDEADDTIESQVGSVETKYDPVSPFYEDTTNLHITSSIDSEKLNASSRRESLRSHQCHIKIEKELSDEKILQLTNGNGNKSKRSSSRKVRIIKEHIGKSTFGGQKYLSKRKNKSDRKITEANPQQRNSGATSNSKLFKYKIKEDNMEQNTKEANSERLSKGYVCEDCGKFYSKPRSLYVHRRMNHGSLSFMCEDCGKTMKSKVALTNHKIRKHASEKEKHKWKKACKKCGAMVFTFALHVHIAKTCVGIPRVKEKYTCDQCGMEYTTAQGFDDHLLTHSEEPKQCNVCSKVFLTSKRLLAHKKAIHAEKVRKFACQKCPAAFTSENYLKHHQYVHTESRKFVCELCGITYKYPQNLRTHLKCHKEIQEKGVGAFTCDICNDGKRFAHSKSLKGHKLLKHGTKVYQCSYCGKKLSCGTNLRQHEALHKKLPGFNPRAEMKRKRGRNVSGPPSTEETTELQTNENNN